MKYVRIFRIYKLTKFDTIHTWYYLCVSDDFLSMINLLENDDKCVCAQKFGNYVHTKNDIYNFICNRFDKEDIKYFKYDDHLKFYVNNDDNVLSDIFDIKSNNI